MIYEHFQVFVEPGEIARLREELRGHEVSAKLATWIRTLVEHLSAGVQGKRYILLPVVPDLNETSPAEMKNADVKSLKELLTAQGADGDRLWADDRWINGHQRAGSMQVVDSVDILTHLQSLGRMSSAEYYDMIGRMRAEGICFIPVTKDEILANLKGAHVLENRLVETSRLRNLRRGFAASLLRSHLLQRPLANDRVAEAGELAFLIQSIRGCADALSGLWTMFENTEEIPARANWIVESLYVDQHALRRIAGLAATPADDTDVSAFGIAALLSKTISMQGSQAERTAAKNYLDWVFQRLIAKRLHFEPGFLNKAASVLRRILTDVAPESLNDLPSRASAVVIQRLLRDLPKPLQMEVVRDSDFMARLGTKMLEVVELGTIRFERIEYLTAAREAINGRSATVRVLDQNKTVEFRPGRSAGSGFEFQHPEANQTIQVDDPVLALLLESIEQREIFARGLVRDLDVPSSESASTVAELVSTSDPPTRVGKAEELRNESLSSFLSNLSRQIQSREGLRETDLLPRKPGALPRFMRMQPSQALDSASVLIVYRQLEREKSMAEALDRIFRLPIELPVEIAFELMSLSLESKRTLIKALLRQSRTPLFEVHLARILTADPLLSESYRRLANRIMTKLMRSMNSEVRAYLTLVRWSSSKLSTWLGTGEWSQSFLLGSSWLLADRVFDCFRSQCDPQWLVDTFSVTASGAESIFEGRSEIQTDVAHPTNIGPEVFVMCALGYVFAEDASRHMDDHLREEVGSILLLKNEDHCFPAVSLLPSPSNATNQLASFFGRDRIAALFDAIQPARQEALRAALHYTPQEQARVALETMGVQGWLILGVVLGGFPPPQELVHSIDSAIRDTEFQKAAENDAQLGAIALSIATGLLPFTKQDDAVSKLREQLISFARSIASAPKTSGTGSLAPVLLESSFNIARMSTTLLDRISDFGALTAEIAIEWPRFGEEVRPIIQRLCEELPAGQTTELWRLNLRLRTE